MSLSKEQANAALFSLPSIFAYSSPIFAPLQGLTQTVTQTRKKAGGYRRTQWIAHRAESTQKRRKALWHNAFRRSSYLHTQEVTGSSPAVSTKNEKIRTSSPLGMRSDFSFLSKIIPAAIYARRMENPPGVSFFTWDSGRFFRCSGCAELSGGGSGGHREPKPQA